MFQEERRTWLTSHARSNGRVDVNESAEALGVTVETIRRDLNDLENKNLLRRLHGGATPIEGYVYESSLATRKNQFIDEKRRITEKALEFIGEAETIFLDEGYTPNFCRDLEPTTPGNGRNKRNSYGGYFMRKEKC